MATFSLHRKNHFHRYRRTETITNTPGTDLLGLGLGLVDQLGQWATTAGYIDAPPTISTPGTATTPATQLNTSNGQSTATKKIGYACSLQSSGTGLTGATTTNCGTDFLTPPASGFTLSGQSGQTVTPTFTFPSVSKKTGAGTVAATTGSKTITGSGGADFTNLSATFGGYQHLDEILIDGVAYEVDTVTNATSLELMTNYAGSTGSGKIHRYGGNLLIPNNPAGTGGTGLDNGYLSTGSGETTKNFKQKIGWLHFATNARGAHFLRKQADGSRYTVSTTSAGAIQIYWVNSSGVATTVGTVAAANTPAVCDLYHSEVEIEDVTSPSTSVRFTVNIFNEVTGLSILAGGVPAVIYDTNNRITTNGDAGIGNTAGTAYYRWWETYTDAASLLLDKSEVKLYDTVTVIVSGESGYLTTPPTIGVTGSTGVSKVSQTVLDDSHISVVINTGSVAGKILFTNPLTTATAELPSKAAAGPEATYVISSLDDPNAVTVKAAAAAQYIATSGNTTYQLVRNATYGFTAASSGTTNVGSAQVLAAGVVPTQVAATGLPAGKWSFGWKITDPNGQVSIGQQVLVNVLGASVSNAGCEGDSLTVGHGTDYYTVQGWMGQIQIVTAGSGQTTGRYPITTNILPAGCEMFEAYVNVSSGAVQSIEVVKPGYGWNESLLGTFTLTYTYAGPGTKGTLSSNGGSGGFAMQIQESLRAAYGVNVRIGNFGLGGAGLGNYDPSHPSHNSQTSMATATALGNFKLNHLLFGANDSNGILEGDMTDFANRVALYETRLRARCVAWETFGAKVLISHPMPVLSTGDGNFNTRNALLAAMGDMCDLVRAESPTTRFIGLDRSDFATFMANPRFFQYPNDLLHYSVAGYAHISNRLGPIFAWLLGYAPSPIPSVVAIS